MEICQKATSEMSGKKFSEIKLRRNDKIKTMYAKHATVNARGQCIEVKPTLLINRINCALNKSYEMSENFLLTNLLPSHFSFYDGVIRKPPKRSLGLLLKSFTQQ